MRLEKTKNTTRNIVHGLINKIVLMILPFVTQTVIIKYLGEEYAGIKGLFTSILQVFNLTELGMGSAIVFSMYKPIAQNDDETICALMNLYKKIYMVIGIVILSLGILIVPFVPIIISGNYPEEINIRIVFLLYVIDTVLSYWCFAYKSSILSAFQRNDILSSISTVVFGGMQIAQIIILYISRNYYVYLLCSVVFTAINGVMIYFYSNKLYPQYVCQGWVSKELISCIKKKVSGLFVYKVCGATRNSLDCIFITMFLGLKMTAIYSNYLFVFTALTRIMGVITNSLVAGVGNSIKLDSIDKNKKDMDIMNFIYIIISGAATICLFCLYQPFMEIWVGKKLILTTDVVFLLCIYFFLLRIGEIRAVYSDASGLWWENRYRTIAESISNIILNYILGKFFGIQGIIIATIIPLFLFGYVGAAKVLYRYYIKKGFLEYLIKNAMYTVVTFVIGFIVYRVCSSITGGVMWVFVSRMFICIFLIPVLYFAVYFKTNEFCFAKKWIFQRLN